MTYLRNCWYMAAWSDEVADAPFRRIMLEMPVLIYRDPADGRAIAMLDSCPHRFAPLSRGEIIGANIRCGYHGLQFNPSGECVHNPFSNVAPAAAKVRTFPLIEQDGIIWIWTGTPDAVDTGSIPRFPHHHDPELRCVHGMTTANADYRLLIDNLMDLTHVAFLHPGFGGQTFMPKVSGSEESDGSIIADFVIDEMPNWLGPEELPGEMVRLHDRMHWFAPSMLHLVGRATSLSHEGAVWESPAAHILTPETQHTTHYFWSSAVAQASSLSDEAHMALLRQAFNNEDKPMIEAVQMNMGDSELWDMDPILLKQDAGSVRVRRKLQSLIDAEQ